jgi:hypothetical protein
MSITVAQDTVMMFDQGIESAVAIIEMSQGKFIEQCII